MISVYLDLVRDALYPRKRGLLTKRNKFLAVADLNEMSAEEIKKLRLRLRLSSGMFASVMGVSEKTVEAWERGTNKPSGSSLRLMNMLSIYPDILVETRTVFETGDVRQESC